MGLDFTCWQVSQLPERLNSGVGGHAGWQAAQSLIVEVEAVAIERCKFVLLSHRKTVGGAVLHAIAAEDADPEINGVIAQLLLLGLLVHHPVHHRQIDGADPNADLTGNAFVELVVNPPAIALRRNQLFVGVLHRHWTALHVIEGDSQALREIARSIDGVAGVITNLFEETEHWLKSGKERSIERKAERHDDVT